MQLQKERETNNAMKCICIFKGEIDNPLLAPRSVNYCNNVLVVSDTGQNRVFIWKKFSYNNYQNADVVLGQTKNIHTERNAGHQVNASTLQYPSGIWTNGEMLIVADAWNHRVLIWNQMPEENGQPADVVIGQKDFNSNQPNVSGVGKACSAQSLYWPYGVCSNGKELWIADTGNRRVLYYNKIPTRHFEPADAVIGQNSFTERDYDNENAIWPYSVKINEYGNMAIADTQYYRVLLWQHWSNAFTQKAEAILGQPDMQSNGLNQYQSHPSAQTLSWCYDACFFKNGIALADTGNSRILLHQQIPREHNSRADSLIGQINFTTHGESSLSMKSSMTNEMYWPFAVTNNEDILIVGDTGNHQILFYK